MILSHGLATARTFSFAFTGNASDVNLRVAALAAGWNGVDSLVATINSGVVLFGSTTASYGLTIDGAYPRGVWLTVAAGALITGKEGSGGAAVSGHAFGNSGNKGGSALRVSVPVTITNNGSLLAGGGGGGGGGGALNPGDVPLTSGGGGRGASNGVSALPGSAGGTSYGGTYAGNGGAGGAIGAAGSAGANGYSYVAGTYASTSGGPGGAAGEAVEGNTYITWLVTGTRTGPIV